MLPSTGWGCHRSRSQSWLALWICSTNPESSFLDRLFGEVLSEIDRYGLRDQSLVRVHRGSRRDVV